MNVFVLKLPWINVFQDEVISISPENVLGLGGIPLTLEIRDM